MTIPIIGPEHDHRFRWSTKDCACGMKLADFDGGPHFVAHFVPGDGPTEMAWFQYTYSNQQRTLVAREEAEKQRDERMRAEPPPPLFEEGEERVEHADDESGTVVTRGGKLVMFNEGGCNDTSIDVRVLIAWLREHRPELLS